MSNITDSVMCIGFACARDLPDVEDQKRPQRGNTSYEEWKLLPYETFKRRPNIHEVEVYSFPQGWGSTALGFGGVGGQTITTAQTTVIISGHSAAVYFGYGLAYVIERVNTKFMADISNHNMAERSKAGKYRTP